jgi:hypothetical protein
MRIRWGWIIGCVVLGLAAIAGGFLLVASPDRTAHVASVLAGVGTRLLLVGIVVLLERRIVKTAATAVRRAVNAEREASDARIERLVGDLEDRLSAEWARSGAADVDAVKRRTAELTDETVQRIVGRSEGIGGRKQARRRVAPPGVMSVVEDVPADRASTSLVIEDQFSNLRGESISLPFSFPDACRLSLAGGRRGDDGLNRVRRSTQIVCCHVWHRRSLPGRQGGELRRVG